MKNFDYLRAGSIGETLKLIERGPGNGRQVLAGGTDLLPLLKADVHEAMSLVDIKRLGEMEGIERNDSGGIRIGALCTLSALKQDERIGSGYPMLATAVSLAATTQIRNRATVGGNLLQRPRCWYFRHPDIPCWLKNGEDCPAENGENQLHAIFPSGPCNAVHPSDLAPVLQALEAEVEVLGPAGEKRIPVDEFFSPPETARRTETVLGTESIVTAIHLPQLQGETRMSFQKAMTRHTWSFALASVAICVHRAGDVVADIRIVAGGVAAVPWRLFDVEEIVRGEALTDGLVELMCSSIAGLARPLSHNGYKVPLLEGLLRQALREIQAN